MQVAHGVVRFRGADRAAIQRTLRGFPRFPQAGERHLFTRLQADKERLLVRSSPAATVHLVAGDH